MCQVFIISDLHFGHKGMAEYRGFGADNVADHNNYIISQWNSIVKSKRDLVYILGDITMENDKYYYLLNDLNGRKIVVLGNHDKSNNIRKLLDYVENVAGAVEYKGYILTHIPIEQSQLDKYRANIHGHIHMNHLENPKYINVCCDVVDYKPLTFDQILLIRKERELNHT